MHTYIKGWINTKEGKRIDFWEVGSWSSEGEWHERKQFLQEIQAVCFTNYLNGGSQDSRLIKAVLEEGDAVEQEIQKSKQ